jgi:hypothetical protein
VLLREQFLQTRQSFHIKKQIYTVKIAFYGWKIEKITRFMPLLQIRLTAFWSIRLKSKLNSATAVVAFGVSRLLMMVTGVRPYRVLQSSMTIICNHYEHFFKDLQRRLAEFACQAQMS